MSFARITTHARAVETFPGANRPNKWLLLANGGNSACTI
jgi:hypothetical protein